MAPNKRNHVHLFEALMELGMTDREARVYLALLQKRRASVSELQRLSGVPQTKMYETVNSLMRSGHFIERKEGRMRIFEIVDPKASLNSLFNALDERMNKAKSMQTELEKLYHSGTDYIEPFEFIEVIRGNESIHYKYVEMQRNAENEFLGFARPPFALSTKKMVEEQSKSWEDMLSRGVKTRIVFELNENSSPLLYDAMEHSKGCGDDFRISPKLPIKCNIFDQKTLFLTDEAILADRGELIYVVIKQKTTVNGYIALFEFFWNQGLRYDEWMKENEKIVERIKSNPTVLTD